LFSYFETFFRVGLMLEMWNYCVKFAVVNFTNFLPTAFSYKSFLQAFFANILGLNFFWRKYAHKILAKLTIGSHGYTRT
jgi:hypothetical protein